MDEYEQEALRQFMEQYITPTDTSGDYGQSLFNTPEYYESPAYNWLNNMIETSEQEGAGVAGANLPTGAGAYQEDASGKTSADFSKIIKNMLSSPLGRVGLPLLLGYAANRMRQKPTGGGTTVAYGGPRQYQRSISDGIAKYAANGGLMQAYASGGVTGTHQSPLHMEDGGFVMTKKAVDGAGGPRGISQLLPGARPIFGPGTGTSDDIPATIAGTTPARVSNGEAYVPKAVVDQAGGASALYALMDRLQRRA